MPWSAPVITCTVYPRLIWCCSHRWQLLQVSRENPWSRCLAKTHARVIVLRHEWSWCFIDGREGNELAGGVGWLRGGLQSHARVEKPFGVSGFKFSLIIDDKSFRNSKASPKTPGGMSHWTLGTNKDTIMKINPYDSIVSLFIKAKKYRVVKHSYNVNLAFETGGYRGENRL